MAQRTTSHHIAANIRRLMAEKGINQTELGSAASLSQSAFSRRLLGQAEFSVKQLEAVAAELGVAVADLIADSDAPKVSA